MRVWSWKLAALGILCFAPAANAVENPYGAPAALQAPGSRVSPYWQQYGARRQLESSPSDLRPEALGQPTPAVQETVVEGYNGPQYAPPAANGYAAPAAAPCNGNGAGAAYGYDGAAGAAACDGGYGAGYGDGYGYGAGGGSAFAGALGGFSGAAPCCNPWFVSAQGLVMGRDRGNRNFTTFDNTNPNAQLLSTRDARMDTFRGGFEIRGGRRFGANCNLAIEASFFWLDQFRGSGSVTGNGNLNTTFDGGFINFATSPVSPGNSLFDNADRHTVYKSSQFYGAEVNFLRMPLCCGDTFQATWLVGARWFHFDEYFYLDATRNTAIRGVTSACMHNLLNNNLVGAQVGARLNWNITPCFSVYANPTAGLFANNITSNTDIYTNTGLHATTNPPNGYPSESFPVRGAKTDVSFMGQLDVGASYQIGCHWRVFAGYRVIGVAGVALTDNQLPRFMNDTPEWRDIKSNGNVILHGAYGGAEFRF